MQHSESFQAKVNEFGEVSLCFTKIQEYYNLFTAMESY